MLTHLITHFTLVGLVDPGLRLDRLGDDEGGVGVGAGGGWGDARGGGGGPTEATGTGSAAIARHASDTPSVDVPHPSHAPSLPSQRSCNKGEKRNSKLGTGVTTWTGETVSTWMLTSSPPHWGRSCTEETIIMGKTISVGETGSMGENSPRKFKIKDLLLSNYE